MVIGGEKAVSLILPARSLTKNLKMAVSTVSWPSHGRAARSSWYVIRISSSPCTFFLPERFGIFQVTESAKLGRSQADEETFITHMESLKSPSLSLNSKVKEMG